MVREIDLYIDQKRTEAVRTLRARTRSGAGGPSKSERDAAVVWAGSLSEAERGKLTVKVREWAKAKRTDSAEQFLSWAFNGKARPRGLLEFYMFWASEGQLEGPPASG